ncbi:MAG: toll/interleukin-1 receptor domain-containing protein [Ginsengibacter sp.]
MAINIFISYRKDDSKWNTQILYDRLTQFFPARSLFKDFNTIKAGANYRDSIASTLEKCNVLLVVMGKAWLDITDTNKRRRLDNPEDLVRIEIATALKRNIRVIPVLFDNIDMPAAATLPEDLQSLTLRQCISVSETNFDYDIRHLAEAIKNKTIEKKNTSTLASLLKYRMVIPALCFIIIGWLINKLGSVPSLRTIYFFMLLVTPLLASLIISAFLKARANDAMRKKYQRIALISLACFFITGMAYIYYYQQHTYLYKGFGGSATTYMKGSDYTPLAASLKADHPNMKDADILKKFLGGPGEAARLWTESSLKSARFFLILIFEFIVIFAAVGVSILLQMLYYKNRK